MENQFWAVGRWSGLDCEIKGSGPYYEQLLRPVFSLFFKNTVASALKSCIEKRLKKKFGGWEEFFISEKPVF